MEDADLSKLNIEKPDDFILSFTHVIRNLQSEEDVKIEDKHTKQDDPMTLLAVALLDVLKQHQQNSDKNHELEHRNSSSIQNSGNSDVDIKINIDLSSIALAMLYALFASKQLTLEELETALKRLQEIK